MDSTANDSTESSFKQKFEQKLSEYEEQHQGSQRKPWTQERIFEVIHQVKQAGLIMDSGGRRTAMEYYWMAKYDVMSTADEDHLIFKRKSTEDPIICIVPREEYFDILKAIHKSCGHGGRDKMLHNINTKYYIPKKAVEIFISLCPSCEAKRNIPKKRSLVTLPIASQDFNIRGQVDLEDYQSCADGDYKWLLIYQDSATKFLSLRPLKTERVNEVAVELIKIFMTFGAPDILQSNNGHKFIAELIKELITIWPDCKIIQGDPSQPQTKGSVEQGNQDVENMLQLWMSKNKSTNWSLGCFFVQYQKNVSLHHIIGSSPYKALFGRDPKASLSVIKTEEQLKKLSERQLCGKIDENCTNYKETELSISNTDDIPDETSANSVENVKIEIIWESEEDEQFQRNVTHIGLKREAEKSLDNMAKKLPPLAVGDTVIISIAEVDRGPLNTKNMKGKIVDFQNGVYRVGTKSGTIEKWFSRHELQVSTENYNDEILDIPITLREAVNNQFIFKDLGLQKCTCKPAQKQCHTNRCACFKKKVRCGSKCHSNITCVNK